MWVVHGFPQPLKASTGIASDCPQTMRRSLRVGGYSEETEEKHGKPLSV